MDLDEGIGFLDLNELLTVALLFRRREQGRWGVGMSWSLTDARRASIPHEISPVRAGFVHCLSLVFRHAWNLVLLYVVNSSGVEAWDANAAKAPSLLSVGFWASMISKVINLLFEGRGEGTGRSSRSYLTLKPHTPFGTASLNRTSSLLIVEASCYLLGTWKKRLPEMVAPLGSHR